MHSVLVSAPEDRSTGAIQRACLFASVSRFTRLFATSRRKPVWLALSSLLLAANPTAAAPTAFAGGPYRLTLRGSVLLDGASSNAAEPGVTIAAYNWDIDGDGLYDDLVGPQPTLSWSWFMLPAGTNTIGLRVTDTLGATATATAVVNVVRTHLSVHDLFQLRADAVVYPTEIARGPDERFYGVSKGRNAVPSMVWRLEADGSNLIVLHRFDAATEGALPVGMLVTPDGAMYGINRALTPDQSSLWRMNINGSGFQTLRVLDRALDGSGAGALVLGADGFIYGAQMEGGADGAGTLWRMNADGTGFVVLRHFNRAADGALPLRPVFGPDGLLYGATHSGGTHDRGTIWRINANGSGFAVLRHLGAEPDGGEPNVPVFGPDGLLYGTTARGGTTDNGTIWRMAADGTDFTVLRQMEHLRDFGSAATPSFGPDGRLHGTASPDHGIHWAVWSMDPDGTDYVSLVQPSGMAPSRLLVDAGGTLFGTLMEGGQWGDGAFWQLPPGATEFTALRDFAEFTTGESPTTAATLGRDYLIYGSSRLGGAKFGGNVWKLEEGNGLHLVVLKEFGIDDDGSYPLAPTLRIGRTQGGLSWEVLGSTDRTVWRLNNPSEPEFTVLRRMTLGGDRVSPFLLFSFDQLLGWNDTQVWLQNRNDAGFLVLHEWNSALLADGVGVADVSFAAESIYGATSRGGQGDPGSGTLWHMNSDGSGFRVLRRMDRDRDGASPLAPQFRGGGVFIGVCREGGAHGLGTLWRINDSGSEFTVLRHFTAADGAHPLAAASPYGSDRITGVSVGDPSDPEQAGTLWRIDPDGSHFEILHRFDRDTEGSQPSSRPMFHLIGEVCGANSYGGRHGRGTVYVWANEPPVAQFDATAKGLTLELDASASADVEGDGMVYEWSFGDGASVVVPASPVTTHTFAAAGTYTVSLRVTDSLGQPSNTVSQAFTISGGGASSDPAPLSPENWTVAFVDSEEVAAENAAAANAFDGNRNTFWHSQWSGAKPTLPHDLQIDLGQSYVISAFVYVPRQDKVNGRIGHFEFYASPDGIDWGTPVALGEFANTSEEQHVTCTPKAGRFVRLRALTDQSGTNYRTSVAELIVLGATTAPAISRSGWALAYVDSQETSAENGAAVNAFDGGAGTFWHSQWSSAKPPLPHELQIDLGASYVVSGFRQLPRQDGKLNGRIRDYEFYVSGDGLNWGAPVAAGSFAQNAEWQEITFVEKAGRFVRLRALSDQSGTTYRTAVAELELLGLPQPPAPIAKAGWTVVRADSEETIGENAAAACAIDGNPSTHWHSQWAGAKPLLPHEIVIDLGTAHHIAGLRYLPRQDGKTNGRIGQFEFYVGSDGTNWDAPAATGSFAASAASQHVMFASKTGRFVRLRALTDQSGTNYRTSMAELDLFEQE